MDDGGLRVYDVKDEKALEVFLRHPEIHAGEAETLAATKEFDGLAMIDEREARSLARIYGIRSVPGTIFLLFRLLNLERMDAEEADETLSGMIA